MDLQQLTATILSGSVFLLASAIVLYVLNRFYFNREKWFSRIIVKPVYRLCTAIAIVGAIFGLSLNVYVAMVS